MNSRELLLDSFRAALTAADPLNIVPKHLPPPPAAPGRTIVIGAGKGAASMAKAVESHWPHDAPLEGLVITRYAHGYAHEHRLSRIRVVEAGHPVPDLAGQSAAKEIMQIAESAREGDLVLALISGGGSSLMSLPAADISIADLKAVTEDLLNSGAPIQEMNVVRKHLSAVQGGQIAAVASARGARVLALIVSDVTGDDPSAIASGPTAPDPSTFQDALDILNTYRITPPISVARHLSRGARGEVPETLKPGDARFERIENRIIATAQASLNMAGAFFQQRGITPMILGDSVTGEAREVAKVYAALARQIHTHHHPLRPPVALISGGECTVTVRKGNRGRGGRCSEFLLSLAIELEGLADVTALACDTDGIDGSEQNAGAYMCGKSVARARAREIDAKQHLIDNDAFGYFAALDDLIVTGPTRTNVNDYRVILIAPTAAPTAAV